MLTRLFKNTPRFVRPYSIAFSSINKQRVRAFSVSRVKNYDPITEMAMEAEKFKPKDHEEIESNLEQLEKDLDHVDAHKANDAFDKLLESYKSLYMFREALDLLKRRGLSFKKDVFGSQSKEFAQVYSEVAKVSKILGMWREALVNQQSCIELKSQVYGFDEAEFNQVQRRDLAKDYDLLGVINNRIGNKDGAKDNFEKAISLFEFGEQENIPIEHVETLYHLSSMFYTKRQFEESYKLLDKASQLYNRVSTNVPTEKVADVMSEVYLSMANSSMYLEAHTQESEPLYMKAVTILESAFGPKHERVGRLYYSLGVLKSSRGDPDAAEKYTNQALSILEAGEEGSNYHERKLEMGKCFLTLGTLYRESNPEKAIDFFKKSLELHSSVAAGPQSSTYDFNDVSTKLGNINGLDVAHAFNVLGSLYLNIETPSYNLEESFKYLNKALVVSQTISQGDGPPGDNIVAASTLMNMGLYFQRKENFDEAHNHFKSSYYCYSNIYPNDFHPYLGPLCYQWSRNYLALGKVLEAKRSCELSRDIVLGTSPTAFHPLLDANFELLREIQPKIDKSKMTEDDLEEENRKDKDSDVRERMVKMKRKVEEMEKKGEL